MGWLNIPLGGGAVYEVGDPRVAVTGAVDSWVSDRAAQAGSAAAEEGVRTLSEAATSGQLDEAARALGARAGEGAREAVAAELRNQLIMGAIGVAVVAGVGYLGYQAARKWRKT